MAISKLGLVRRRVLARILAAVLFGAAFPAVLAASPAAAAPLIITNCSGTGSTASYLPSAVPAAQFLCRYHIRPHRYDSRQHYFLVGTNSEVFHSWERCSGCGTYTGWASLGGIAQSYVTAANATIGGNLVVAINVTGIGGEFCKAYNRPPRIGQWSPGQYTWDPC